jgi:hypothetical protein
LWHQHLVQPLWQCLLCKDRAAAASLIAAHGCRVDVDVIDAVPVLSDSLALSLQRFSKTCIL